MFPFSVIRLFLVDGRPMLRVFSTNRYCFISFQQERTLRKGNKQVAMTCNSSPIYLISSISSSSFRLAAALKSSQRKEKKKKRKKKMNNRIESHVIECRYLLLFVSLFLAANRFCNEMTVLARVFHVMLQEKGMRMEGKV